ncbi:MAG: vWA domain-containing protein [Candidatus Eisenbacteria bacterium]
MNRLHPIGAALVACLLPAALHAYTYPVDHQGGPRATATFVEDHGGWHGGIDLPRSNGATQVRATGDEKVFHVYTTDFKKVKVENNDNASVAGPWALELSHSSQKYMLDILAVRRVTPGKPAIAYHVDHVVETQPGFADDGVVLVANFPSNADSLVAGDQLEVDYAYYSDRIFQLANVSIVGTEYRYYSHIDGIHQYVAWNSYPATAANRFYGDDTDIPAGRAAHVLSEGEYFADIETLKTFASEPQHLHFGLAGVFTFPEGTTNPLSNIVFATDDPQGNRPYVRSIGLLYGQNEYRFPDSKLYGRVNILVESRDDMGSPEANDDGDGAENATREAGCYNAGYWITAEHGVGEEVASAAQPNKMFEGPGKDTITANDPLRAVLIPAAPYKIDVNTNYHLVVSHVEGDSTRFWNTRAKKGSALNDGSDAPIAAVNSEARFGDGRYQIHAKARDVVAYGATRDSMVTVDNFRPFVRKVVVRDDSGELYSGEWSFDGAEIVFQYADPDEGMLDDQGNKRCADGQSDVVIEVTFSEGMQDAQMSAIEPLGYTPTLSRMPAGQDTLWSATIPKAKLKTKREKAGRQILEIFGTDWANNDVRQISTPAAIDPDDNSRDGAVMRGPSGIDELHRFAICQPVALVCDVTGSMYDEIEDVRVAMREFIDRNEANPNRFPLYHVVTFEDDVEILLSSKKAEEARNVLNQLNAGFGGACPEASVSALDSLPSLMPGGGAAVLATDADPMEGRPRLDATIEKLRAQDIEVNTLLSGSCEAFFAKAPPSGFAEADYAAATRGNDDSPASAERSGGSDVPLPTLSDLFGTIDARVAFREVSNGTGGRYVESFPNAEFVGAVRVIADCLEANALLLSRKGILVAPSAQVEAIPVDASCSELIVLLNYALGDETSLALRRPNGTTVLPTDPDASITFAPGVASVHVNAPAAGEWSAEVACVSGHGRIELSALARSSRRAELGGTPNRRAGTLAPLVVTLEGAGAPSAFRLLRDDGSEVQPLSLFDDGLHDDGVAGDGTFGATVAIPDTGAYRIAVDALDQGSNYARETARTVVVGLPRIASADSLEFGALSIGRATPLTTSRTAAWRRSW